MSSSSSSSLPPKTTYDVFLNFRGADTRDNFTSHLYSALCREKIQTFIDDRLNRGEEIEASLMKVIEESEISVVIFSKGYASSPWCLDELVKILDCRKILQRKVLPVFYHVDTSDVEEQTGIFGEAFWKLESQHKERMDIWRNALMEATTLSGWDYKNHRPDSVLLDVVVKVVKVIKVVLNQLYQIFPIDSSGFVGIASHIQKIESLLCIGSGGVRCIGIWGMGGMGKSTCAEFLYHRISDTFDGCYFLANVRENLEKHTLLSLKQKIISQILKDESVLIETPNALPESIIRRLQRMKVLIVLDDVNEVSQLENLVGSGDWFAPGSRIIITSRDLRVHNSKIDKIYKVNGLHDTDALHLFSLTAFKQQNPPLDYMKLSKKVVNYARGVPLVLKVLGSHLRNKSQNEWKMALDKIIQFLDSKIQKVLEISYEELKKSEKDIFLDIACFFKGYKKDWVEDVLNGCELNASLGIIRLVEKCLISIVDDKLEMHDLIQEMGWDIAKRNHSRFWKSTGICHMLSTNKIQGKEAIEGISLNLSEVERKIYLSHITFSGMDNLRILKFYTGNYMWNHFMLECASQSEIIFQCLPDKLSLLHWEKYPCKLLPSNFVAENLVELNMSYSRLEQVWEGDQCPRKLKQLDLSYCLNLERLPDLSAATNLVFINLRGCKNLVEIPSSIQNLHNLDSLILDGCEKLQNVPSLVRLKSLKTLYLSYCYNLKILSEIPSGIEELHMIYCRNLLSLPSLVHLNSLILLDLSDCSNLNMLPHLPRGLQKLCLSYSGLEEWSPSTRFLNNLKELNMCGCKNLRSLPISMELNSLEEFDIRGSGNLKKLPEINGTSLKTLILVQTGIEELPSSTGCLSSLVTLILNKCERLESLPSSICELNCLEELKLEDCSKLTKLPPLYGLVALRWLYLDGTAVLNIPSDIVALSSLTSLSLDNCKKLQGLPKLPKQLEYLSALNCTSLETAEKSLSFAFADCSDKRSYRSNYFNCFNLDQRSHCNIIEDSMLRIEGIAMADKFNTYATFAAAFPGSEVPDQFEYQTEGSSISIKLPPHYKDRGVDFSFCAVVDGEAPIVIPYYSSLKLQCKWCSEKSNGKPESDTEQGKFGFCGGETINIESDHVFIWYEKKTDLRSVSEVSFKFTGNDFVGKLKIKKCGVRISSKSKREKTRKRNHIIKE